MKKCIQCGTLQDNKNIYCIDCNAKLDAPLPNNETNNLSMDNIQNVSSDESDYFYVSMLDKVISGILLIFAILHYILLRLNADYLRENGMMKIGLGSILLAFAAIIETLLPDICWEHFKLKFRFSVDNADEMKPSRSYLLSRKYCSKIVLILVVISFVVLLVASFRAKS